MRRLAWQNIVITLSLLISTLTQLCYQYSLVHCSRIYFFSSCLRTQEQQTNCWKSTLKINAGNININSAVQRSHKKHFQHLRFHVLIFGLKLYSRKALVCGWRNEFAGVLV